MSEVNIVYNGDNAAGALLAQAMSNQWGEAEAMVESASDYVAAAQTAAATVPTVMSTAVADTLVLPVAPILDLGNDTAENLYAATETEILAMLKSHFASFIASYFPKEALYASMLDWCEQAVTQGGSGIAVEVERALWERDRARINAEMSRGLADVEEAWAGRGFPVPPGALLHQQNQIRIAAAQQLAESSRTAAIKSREAELENVRFAVSKVIDQRQVALGAARDYIMALAQAPQIAQQLASSFAGLRNQAAQAMVSLYAAQLSALDPKLRIAITDAQLSQAAAEANQKASLQIIDERVKAALTAAELCGRVAAAAANAVAAHVSYSGREDS